MKTNNNVMSAKRKQQLLSSEDLNELVSLKMVGFGSRHIASLLGISKSSVNNYYNNFVNSQLPNVIQSLHDSFEGDIETVQVIEEARNEDRKVAMNRKQYGTDYHPDDVAFKHKKKPKILFLDVESTPDVAVTFKRFKANMSQEHILQEGGWLLSIAYAFNEGEVISSSLTPSQACANDDSQLVAELWCAIEEADMIVAHNLDRFDMPLFKARCVINGFAPPKRVKQIDTLKLAKQMKFQSNRLDSLGYVLGEGSKIKHSGIDLWVKCMEGDLTSLQAMEEYNRQDVVLLRNVYHRLKAFDNNHPNAALYTEGDEVACRVCGSHDVRATANQIQAGSSLFSEVICNDCGARSRLRQGNTSKDKRKSLLA